MQLSTERQDRLIRWLTAAGIYYICLIAFYIDIGQDMGAEYFIPVFLPVMLALVLVQYGTHVPLFSWATLPNLFTGLAWCSAFPLLYTWTYHQDWYMSKICFDFLVGTSLFLLLTALEGALFRLGHEKLIAALMALLNLIGLLILSGLIARETKAYLSFDPQLRATAAQVDEWQRTQVLVGDDMSKAPKK